MEWLFSLQVYVDRLTLREGRPRPDAALLVGFQLLQLEIVLLDRSACSATAEIALERGQSCLFQAEPSALLRQLRDESEAPLALLLMAQDGDRARLLAFASVPLLLHVGLEATRDLELRVSEWASHCGQWELVSHAGESVGDVSGTVTLSCLGRTMAPHLTAALGVQVAPIGSQAVNDRAEDSDHRQEAADKGIQDKLAKPTTVDAEVQCEEERGCEVALELPHSGRLQHPPAVLVQGRQTTVPKTNHAPHLHNAVASMKLDVELTPLATSSTSTVTRQKLPPPLYFKKPAR